MLYNIYFLCSQSLFSVSPDHLGTLLWARWSSDWFSMWKRQQTGHWCGFQLRNINAVHISPLMTGTRRWGWRKNKCEWMSVFLLGGKCMIFTQPQWRDETSRDQSVDYFYHAGDDRVRWREYSRCSVYCTWPHDLKGDVGKKKWMNAKGQKLLGNMRSEPARQRGSRWYQAHVPVALCSGVNFCSRWFAGPMF